MKKEYLKIRNDVDLKELEKFGFKTQQNSPSWDYGIETSVYDYAELSVDYSKEICIYVTTEYRDADIPDELLVKLFDIIQAGLVEKVVEDE